VEVKKEKGKVFFTWIALEMYRGFLWKLHKNKYFFLKEINIYLVYFLKEKILKNISFKNSFIKLFK